MQTQPHPEWDPTVLPSGLDREPPEPESDEPRPEETVSSLPTVEEEKQVVLPPVSNPDSRLVAYHDQRSTATEQYRTVRTNLLAMGDQPRVIAVTSATKGEGKTVTTMNLATVLAETPDTRVLVIDCDLRNPSVHRILGQELRPGLMELLKDEISLATAVIQTPLPGVDIIHAGNTEVAPLELFSTHSLRDLLGTLRAAYDFILIDTPPVFSLTDAAVVGPQSDGTLLVVRKHGPPREVVHQALSSLQSSRSRVLGCIMTGVKPNKKYGRYPYADEA